MKRILKLVVVLLIMVGYTACSSSKKVVNNYDKANKEQKLDSDKQNFERNSFNDGLSK